MKNSIKVATLAGLTIALAASPAAAQNAEETLNVALTVEIDIGQAVVSGLDDVSFDVNELPDTSGSVSTGFSARNVQRFCLFTPTQFFSLTATGVTNNTDSHFLLVDAAQTDPNLDKLRYFVNIADIFSGPRTSIGSFRNGAAVTRIDSNLFNTDATCSDGDNLELQISAAPNTGILDSDLRDNGEVVAAIADGQPHNYTDQLTLLVEPEI